jgi:hypothetical protein
MLGTFVKLFLADARIVSAFVFEKKLPLPASSMLGQGGSRLKRRASPPE